MMIVTDKVMVATSRLPGTEAVGQDAKDCSNEKYKCFKAGATILAVPTDGTAPDLRYSFLGVQFSVEKCLYSKDSNCSIALMKSEPSAMSN